MEKTVILTSGPRGIGKTTYTELVKSLHPDVELLSRDKLLVELFGKTSLSPYDGSRYYAHVVLRERLRELLQKDNNKIIFDCWNGSSRERNYLAGMLRTLGADKVICWQFVVELDTCIKWFLKKTDVAGYSEYSCRSDYKLYYQSAIDIEEDGFDAVYRINPNQLTIPGFPLV